MSNEIQTITEETKVTKEILMDYLKTITNSLNDAQRMQFCAVAQAFNLNPFKREIYATTYKDKDGKTNMSVVVGYEVYLKRAELNPNYDGYETEFGTDKDRGMFCTCTVWRKDRNHPTNSKVFLSEYSTGRSLWASKPMVMLEKVAICTAFRRAFTVDFGGIPYAPEELSSSTEEQLKAQGMTEVKAEPQQEQVPAPAKTRKNVSEDEDRANFERAMNQYKAMDEAAFNETMKALSYNTLADVPADKRGHAFNMMKLAFGGKNNG